MHLADLGRPTLPCGAAFSGGKRVGESVSIFYSLHSTQIELLKPVQLLKGSVTSNYYPCSGQVMKVKSISSKGLQGTVSSFMIRAIGSTVHATKLCYLQSTNPNANAMLRNARENCGLLPSAVAPFEISKSQKLLPDMHSIDQKPRNPLHPMHFKIRSNTEQIYL